MREESSDPNCSRRSVIVSNPTKGTRSSTRIRKQRIVTRQEYSEEEDVDDPFADNSDADSNYSENVGRNRKKRKGNREKDRVGSEDCLHKDEEEKNTEVSYRITRSGRIRRVVIAKVPVPLKTPRKKRPASQGIQLSNGLIVSAQCKTVYYNAKDKPSSIPNLNKNGCMRGKDLTRVETASHWFSLDRHFKVGKFLMYKRDKPLLNTTKLALWRIDSKSMLQKFQAFHDEDNSDAKAGLKNNIKFKAVKVYGGWSPLHTDEFVLVPIKVDFDNTKEDTTSGKYIVQIDKDQDLNIDSDE